MRIFSFLFLLLLSFAAPTSAQSTYDVTTQGGSVTGPIAGARPITGTSPVIAVDENGTLVHESGTLSFTTGRRSGSLQVGTATFGAGGNLTITVADLGQLFSGTWDNGATWVVVILANGQHFYRLTGTATQRDSMGNVTATAAVSLTTTTATSVICFFNGSETISSINANVLVP